MSISRQVGKSDFATFTVLCCSLFLFLLSLPCSAQNMNLTGSTNCTGADLDTDLQFVNGPANYYNIVVNNRNVSSRPCIFDGPMYGPSLVPDRVEGHKQYDLCYYCDERLPNGQTPTISPITVGPGQIARQTFRWRTTSASDAEPCLQPKWMSGPILLVAPSLLKQVCSSIEVSRFTLVESPKDAPPPAFNLAADRNLYNEGQSFSLRLSSAEPPVSESGCPTLYVRQRSPDGSTRMDEVHPLAFKDCGRPVLGHESGDWQSGFDLDSGANSRWMGAGEHSLQVFQMVGSIDNPRLEFTSSNVLHIQLADPSLVTRKWAPEVKGIRADITLDKETFRAGEDIPLHMAIENLDAAVPIYSWDAVWDPCMVVAIEVQDLDGHPLSASDRLPPWSICTGHGFGPRPVAKDKIIPLERTLGKEGWLPNHPGTYTVMMTWAPCYDPSKHAPSADAATTIQAEKLTPYAVVHAAATIHIVAAVSSHVN